MAASATVGIFSRLTNARNIVRIIGNHANIARNVDYDSTQITRKYSLDINAIIDTSQDIAAPKKKISKAMKAYLERAKEYDEFMKKEIIEYQIGKRHLANMMGENPENFSQEDVKKAIRYLFPSGLYEKLARPQMGEPEEIFPPKKAAQFDESGRPFHPLFYTCKPNYYQLLHDIVGKLIELNRTQDELLRKGIVPQPEDKLQFYGSEWLTKDALSAKMLEPLNDMDYDRFLAAGDRLANHPYASRVQDFIMSLRKQKALQAQSISIPPLLYTPEGRPYITVKDCKRKTARATVTVFGNGEGKITINGLDLRYFLEHQPREQ